jgi:hypothetical protein
MDSMIRILKPKGVITAQVGSQDKKPKQVDSWLMYLTITLETLNYQEFISLVLIVLGIFHRQ